MIRILAVSILDKAPKTSIGKEDVLELGINRHDQIVPVLVLFKVIVVVNASSRFNYPN